MPSATILREEEPEDELEDYTDDIDDDNRFEYCCQLFHFQIYVRVRIIFKVTKFQRITQLIDVNNP